MTSDVPDIRQIRVAHREAIRVEWVDTDSSGRMHNTAPLRWAERAEHSFLRDANLGQIASLARRRIEVVYNLPLSFSDEFELEFGIADVGRSSVIYRWWAMIQQCPAFEGTTVVVNIDEDGHSTALPSKLRAIMQRARG